MAEAPDEDTTNAVALHAPDGSGGAGAAVRPGSRVLLTDRGFWRANEQSRKCCGKQNAKQVNAPQFTAGNRSPTSREPTTPQYRSKSFGESVRLNE
jgi:hypothetical protein